MSALSQIEQGIYRYSWGFDANDLDLLADCFTGDAVLIEPNGNEVRGRAAIREAFARRRAERLERGEQPRHVTTNVLLLGESPDEADVRAYFVMHATKDGKVISTSVGHYVDRWVRDGDTWRLAYREMNGEGRA